MTLRPIHRLVALVLAASLVANPATVMGCVGAGLVPARNGGRNRYGWRTFHRGPAQGRPLQSAFASQALAHPVVSIPDRHAPYGFGPFLSRKPPAIAPDSINGKAYRKAVEEGDTELARVLAVDVVPPLETYRFFQQTVEQALNETRRAVPLGEVSAWAEKVAEQCVIRMMEAHPEVFVAETAIPTADQTLRTLLETEIRRWLTEAKSDSGRTLAEALVYHLSKGWSNEANKELEDVFEEITRRHAEYNADVLDGRKPGRALAVGWERRDTWPGPAGEYGNAGVAYAFPPNVNRRNASLLKRIVRVLKENRLYYGLKAADVSWLLKGLGDVADDPSGKIAFENERVRARYRKLADLPAPIEAMHIAGDGEFVLGRMHPNGPFVIRLQAEAFRTWRWGDPRKTHSEHDPAARRKLTRAFTRAVRALAGAPFKTGYDRHRILRRARFELRSLHDYYGEASMAEKAIVFYDRLLKNLSALTIVMIHEVNHLLNPGPDSEDRLASDLRLSADALGWSAFIEGLKFLGVLSLVEQASITVKTVHNESLPRMRSPTGQYLGIRLRLNDDLAALFYSTLAKSILALRRPWDDKRNLFPVPLGPLAGAA